MTRPHVAAERRKSKPQRLLGANPIQGLAAEIERDLLAEKPKPVPVLKCFVCEREHMGPTRFCSDRCRDAYDSGYTPQANPDPFTTSSRQIAGGNAGHLPKPMRMGRHGFMINCAGCGHEFDSQGLRCCSTKCEHKLRDRKETSKLMAEVGMERPTKRKCQECGGDIPNWRNGRRVPKNTRFCSPRCVRKNGKRGQTSGTPV
jgi:hypothetical protein